MPLNDPKITVPKFSLGIIIALIAGFAIGFVLEYSKLRRVQTDLDHAQAELQLAEMRDKLTEAHLEVLARNFGNAQARSSEFFKRVQALAAANADPSLQTSLTAMLQQRDEITKLLSQSSPDAEPKIRQLLNQVYKATAEEYGGQGHP